MSDEVLMSVSGLSSGYGSIPVIRRTSFGICPGEIVGVLGHNGMGKTTLMKTLMGLVSTTEGKLVLNGCDITRSAPHLRAKHGLGYVPQGRDIFGSLTVRENLAIGAIALRLNRQRAVERAVSDFPLLKRLLDRKGGELSGGEQQILALARALCGKPKVLLLDEPTEGIQPSIVEAMEDHLRRLTQENLLAIVVVEQDVGFVGAIASRVLWLQKGQIIKELSPAQLNNPDTVDEFVGLEDVVV